MGAQMSFNGIRVVVEIADPGLVALLLSGDRTPFLLFPRANQQLFDPGEPRFDAAQPVGDGVILLRHGSEERMPL